MKMSVSLNSTVVAAPGQVSSDLGGEVAILNVDAGIYYGLGEVGARVWTLVQEPRTVAEVRNTLVSEYDVEPDRCESDVIALLQRLAEEGLVEVGDGAPA